MFIKITKTSLTLRLADLIMGNNMPREALKQSDQYRILFDCETYFQKQLWKNLSSADYNKFSIIGSDDPDRLKYKQLLKKTINRIEKIGFKKHNKQPLQQLNYCKQLQLSIQQNRAIACFLGLSICDAFGASTQFIPFVKNRRDLIEYDFDDMQKQIKNKILKPRIGRIGIWTDDCSMALCIADSLLLNKFQFDARNIRYMFHMWLYHGLNNGGRDHSIGLGGNIKISMDQFTENRAQFTAEKDKFNNGNGSLMRLAPIPLCYLDQPDKALQYAQKQSLTTHNGYQAKQCSKLLTYILIRLITRSKQQQHNWKQVISQACQDFIAIYKTIPQVEHLALSKCQPQQLYNEQSMKYKEKFTKFNKSIKDRNWNWRDVDFTYSPHRNKLQPDYIGSYCMDALAMALHTVWFSSSFEEVTLVNTNMGGDCDTVGAIAGQIAGAIYGISGYMLHLYGQMDDGKKQNNEVFLKAYKLVKKHQI